MEKNLSWKVILIVVLVAVAAWELYPPSKTLKPGLDLAGGTSLIYEIDTQGLTNEEKRDLAERTINVLRRRIDPTNVQNLIWRPQGNTRIEIQMPLASTHTHQKRKAYDEALVALQVENINLATILRSLGKNTEERATDFEQFARGSEERLRILNELADAYDQRKASQEKRDQLDKKLASIREAMEAAGLEVDWVKTQITQWLQSDEKTREKILKDIAGDKKNKLDLLTNYANTYAEWAAVVDELTAPETGKNIQYKKALALLEDINLSIAQLKDVLEMQPKSRQRTEFINQFKMNFPGRAEKIEQLVTVFADYRDQRGRLDDPQDLRRMLKGAGVLEFRVLPQYGGDSINSDEIQLYTEALRTKGPKHASDNQYIWCETENTEEGLKADGVVEAMFGDKIYVLASNKRGEAMLHTSTEMDWKLKKAHPDNDQMGRRAIGFMFDERGGNSFFNVTKNNIGKPLCILLDGLAISAPKVESAITRRGIITGDFTTIEVDDMVNKLNAGSLPARLIEPPISVKTIGPSIGAENRDQGIKAGIIGLAVVAVFMLVYYVGSGSIADIALFLNLLFVLAIMALSRATFTLPGIAGIILTIGMSVDANVLIFERIREEQLRGASLRIAIRNGYQRAFRTILDANVTTFMTAVILYIVASEEIKGFAITLMLGIISSMFTALFVTRVIFQLLLKRRIIKDHLVMLRIMRNPSRNWMAAKPLFIALSVVLVTGGLLLFYLRDDVKNNKYDIEFTGGTSIQINLKEGVNLTHNEVEEKIQAVGAELNNPGISAARVYSIGTTGRQYEINTTETNKTTAQITFSKGTKHTIETIIAAIRKSEKSIGSGQLTGLQVKGLPETGKFTVQTSQVNKTLVKEILQNSFKNEETVISEPVVQEVVNEAIKRTFKGQLEILENLEPRIVSVEKITDAVIDSYPELSDFLGGAKIVCNLGRPTSASDIDSRIKDLQFKPDMQYLTSNPYKILNTDCSTPKADKLLESFAYTSIEPEAGFRELSQDEWTRFVENEKARVISAGSLQTSLPRVTQIDPSVGKQAKTRALVAIILSLFAIIGYIWIRFGTARYGIAAITALVHDVCVTLGIVVACTYITQTAIGQKLLIGEFKINLEMIAAFLTIIGYSLNDTIVVFDRIRENRGRLTVISPQIINKSINQTLSRTLLTSFTTFIVVLIMYIWGGTSLRGFTFAMLLGIIVGTYSSIAIAAPILLGGGKSNKRRR